MKNSQKTDRQKSFCEIFYAAKGGSPHGMMCCFCIGLGSFALGLFVGLFLIAWELERSTPKVMVWAREWPASPYKFP